jgi:hypothetical protein
MDNKILYTTKFYMMQHQFNQYLHVAYIGSTIEFKIHFHFFLLFYTPRKHSLRGIKESACPSVHLSGPTSTSFVILQSSHIMILNSTKFGGNRTKDVEVGPDRWTDGQADSFIPLKLCFRGV